MRTQTMVQLTDDMVRQLDQRAARAGVSRSALIREAITAFLTEEDRQHAIERFHKAYAEKPETAEDLEAALANARAMIAAEPW